MRRLTAEGVAPAEAARWARRAAASRSIGLRRRSRTSTDDPGTATPTIRPRDGGGLAIPVGRAGPAARGLARAAMRLDAPAHARDHRTRDRRRARRGARLGRGGASGAGRHRRAARGHASGSSRWSTWSPAACDRGARGGAPATAARPIRPDPARLRRRGAAHPAAGGAGRRAGRGRCAHPAARRPGAAGGAGRRGRPDRTGRRGALVARAGAPPTRPSSGRCWPARADPCCCSPPAGAAESCPPCATPARGAGHPAGRSLPRRR